MVNTRLLLPAVRVWLTEVLVSGFNYFVLMNLIYEPRWGELTAHQIGMATRILYIFVFAYLLLRYADEYQKNDLFVIAVLWLLLTLAFEWGGSFAIRRPVDEIVVGWNVTRGYMWPYVLLTYLLAVPIVGLTLRPQRARRGLLPPRAGKIPAATAARR